RGVARSAPLTTRVVSGGPPMKKVVLAYSGGLDTSVAVAWLREQHDVEVVTLTVDVGGGSLREGVERRAMSAGASRAYVVDARERFVTDFVWPHLQANAGYEGVPLLDRRQPLGSVLRDRRARGSLGVATGRRVRMDRESRRRAFARGADDRVRGRHPGVDRRRATGPGRPRRSC